MRTRVESILTLFLTVAVVAAGVVASSCGSGAERETVVGPAPVAAKAPVSDPVTVSTSASQGNKEIICHLDATTTPPTWSLMNVPSTAWRGHQSHGDFKVDAQNPSCPPPPECPCFGPTEIETAKSCEGGWGQNCPDGDPPYLLQATCGPATLMFIVDPGFSTCSAPGEGSHTVTPAEAAACQKLICG